MPNPRSSSDANREDSGNCLLAVAAGFEPDRCGVRVISRSAGVVDEAGRPVADAAVDYFWRANGSGRGDDGKFLDLKVEANVKLFWANLGRMEPTHPDTKTGPDGTFRIKVSEIYHAVMAMDRLRQRGGVAILAKNTRPSATGSRSWRSAVTMTTNSGRWLTSNVSLRQSSNTFGPAKRCRSR